MKRLLVSFLLIITIAVQGQDIPARPNPPRLVNDYAKVLSADQLEALERKLVAYDDSTSTQVVVITVPSVQGASIEDYALKILRDWGVGNKKTNNGVVLVAAIQDRKITIQTGYGMEGSITDLLAKTIIDREIVPNFRAQNYYRGFDEATDAIILAAAGKYKAPDDYNNRKKPGGLPVLVLIFIFIIIIVVLSRMGGGGKGGGGMMSRRGILPWLLVDSFLNSGRGGGGGWTGGGGGGWSGGGGGFGGFGGGSGGGGGASGSW